MLLLLNSDSAADNVKQLHYRKLILPLLHHCLTISALVNLPLDKKLDQSAQVYFIREIKLNFTRYRKTQLGIEAKQAFGEIFPILSQY